MAYRLHYSDYSPTEGPPDPAEWIGPPGPMGPAGPIGDKGDQGGLSGGTLTGPLIYTATGGSTPRSAQDRAADVANVLDFGADPTGVADSSAAINAAAATGKTVWLPIGTTGCGSCVERRSVANGFPWRRCGAAFSRWTATS